MAKKEKKGKKRQKAERVVVRRPKVPLTVKDVLVGFVAGVFFVISLVSAGYAMRAAIFGEADPAERQREAARIAAEQAAAAKGTVWISRPDGTFLTGEDLHVFAPAGTAQEPALPEPPEALPDEAAVNEQI